jgi:hypothetical protein
MALGELVDRLAILVVVRLPKFHGMDVADSRSLRSDNYVRMQHFARRTMYVPFGVLGGICGDNSCSAFLLLFVVLWVPISVMLCMRVVLMLWHV